MGLGEGGILTCWGLIPQHVPGDKELTPICSRLCNWCSLSCVILAVACHFCAEYSPVRPAVTDEDPAMMSFLTLTGTLAFGGFFYEGSWAICIRWMGLQAMYQEDPVFRRRLRLNRKMTFVFAFLTSTYLCMIADIQHVHIGWIAEYYGGHQVVYGVRYIEWVCCAPIVLSISGQLAHGPDGKARNGLIPSSLLTGIYCIISWQGIVVADWYWAVALIFWAFVAYFLACYEQLYFAWHIREQGRGGRVRAALLIYLVMMIGIYGVVYLLPIWGWISATFENKFYCVGDASFKLGTSVMLVATNDLASNQELRHRAEGLLDELQRLIDTASVPIFSVNRQGIINDWNKKAEDLTGVPKEIVIGYRLTDMLGEGSKAAGDAMISDALEGNDTGTIETTLNPVLVPDVMEEIAHRKIEVKKATVILSCSSRKDKLGDVVGVCFVGCDLTEVAAYREAEDRKVRFMAVVSHELRSPLHGIIGLMDHLCSSEKEDGRLRYMTLVKSCATRLLDLVVNIMEMASLVKGNTEDQAAKRLSRDPVELTKILEEIVTLVNRSTDKSGHPLVKNGVKLVSEMPQLPIIEADAYKCTQVFYNLITNACKFTMVGSVTINGREDPAGEWVEVSITDTGKGIAKHSLERIFRPFEQEDNSAVRGYQGIGLGLSIAHEVVKRHGGHIFVDSELDVGTTFTVRLPVIMKRHHVGGKAEDYSQNDDPLRSMSLVAPPPTTEAIAMLGDSGTAVVDNHRVVTKNRGGVVLSVDDDPVNQEVLQGILSDYTVHVAMDGFEAIEFLQKAMEKEDLPDIILLDVMMPGMSGFEVCRYVRNELKIPMTLVPVLMLSAATQDACIIEGLDSGANGYVTKPFDRSVLTAHIRSAFRVQREHGRRQWIFHNDILGSEDGVEAEPGTGGSANEGNSIRKRR